MATHRGAQRGEADWENRAT